MNDCPIAEIVAHRGSIGCAIWELLWLSAHVQPDQQASMAAIGAAMGKCRRQVKRNLDLLERAGIIKRTAVCGQAARFTILLGSK